MCFSLSVFVYLYQFVYLCYISLLFMCIFSSVKCLYFSFCLPTSIYLFLKIYCVSIFDLFPFVFVYFSFSLCVGLIQLCGFTYIVFLCLSLYMCAFLFLLVCLISVRHIFVFCTLFMFFFIIY